MIDVPHRSGLLIYPTRAGWTALALALVVSFSAVAQGPAGPGFGNEIPPPVYTTFSVDDGLASNDVAAMIQDRNGYIWFGTQRGVSRFDGYRFESIFPSPFELESGMSLGSGWTHDLLESADGSIWIATGTGVSRYRHDSGRVEDFKGVPDAAPYASSLAEGPDGSLWIGAGSMWLVGQNLGSDGSGLFRLDPSTGIFSSYRFGDEPARGLISDAVMDVAVDTSGHVWIASTSMHSLESSDLSALPPRADWTRAHEFLYFGRRFAAVSSLSRLDVETGLFTHFLSGSGGSETGATDSEELLFALHIDRSGGSGLARFRGMGGSTRATQRPGRNSAGSGTRSGTSPRGLMEHSGSQPTVEFTGSIRNARDSSATPRRTNWGSPGRTPFCRTAPETSGSPAPIVRVSSRFCPRPRV
jgi:streptogramin lyase